MKKRAKTVLLCILLMFDLAACSSNPSRTHQGNLLDDKVIEQRVKSELNHAGADYNTIQVHATNGVVILSGTVNSARTRSHAEQISRGVEGVKHLQDDLRVRR